MDGNEQLGLLLLENARMKVLLENCVDFIGSEEAIAADFQPYAGKLCQRICKTIQLEADPNRPPGK